MERFYFNNSRNYFDLNLIDDKQRGIIVIAPGGGYSHTSPREAEPVARLFESFGYHTAIIKYREEHTLYPKPQEEVAIMVDKLRSLKEVDPHKVIGCGFSAGGHLVLSSHFLNFTKFDGIIMGYPVVSADYDIAHLGSFENLLGDKATNEELRKLVSIENNVKSGAPDLFIWTTITDQAVPMENSLRLISAYQRVKANCEFHLYPMGCHGLSLANKETSGGDDSKVVEHIQSWAMLVKNWLKLKF